MTATLPEAVQQVFDRFVTTEYTTIDRRGQPITWPVTPYYSPGDECIDVTTGLSRSKKAADARANPKVALLFSDPRGSGTERAPQVLVQGTAVVDDRDLAANRERYVRDSTAKLPGPLGMPPRPVRALFNWYFTRVYVHVRPERVYVWPQGDPTREPHLYDARMEEVRSHHDEEPPAYRTPAEGGAAVWDERLDELGAHHPTAALSLVAPDGFPFAVRVPVSVDRAGCRVTLGAEPVGAPLQPGVACLTAHEPAGGLERQPTLQVLGDLVEDDGRWAVVPHRVVGRIRPTSGSVVSRFGSRALEAARSYRTARRELRARR